METMTLTPIDGNGRFYRMRCGNVTATLTRVQCEKVAAEHVRQGGWVDWLEE